MSKYTLWDIPSSSLILETQELDDMVESTGQFVVENGEDALADLLLGIEPDDASPIHDHSGRDILIAIDQERSALKSA